MDTQKIYHEMGISSAVLAFCCSAEEKLKPRFAAIDAIAEYNQAKVVAAMQKNRVSAECFAASTGYGYNDIGREALEKVYADTFHTEAALVRPQITCGTHALALALAANLRPGDELYSPVGRPYDTLEEVIGIRPCKGSLAEFGITYRETELLPDGTFDYENIRKSVIFLLSSNFGEIITMLVSVACGFAAPLKSSHILWINLITDSLPALALGVDEEENKSYMDRPPRGKDESLFAGGGLNCTCFYGALIALISMVAFLQLPVGILLRAGNQITPAAIRTLLVDTELLNRCQTYAFTVLGMSQLFHAIGMRDVETSLFRMNHLENRLMIAAFVIGMGLQLLVTEVPYFVVLFGTCRLTLLEWVKLLVLASMPLFAHELLVFGSCLGEKENRENRK